MKKKRNKKVENEAVLPQNILPVGERVLDNKNIYIHQSTYAKIHRFAANKTENEHGGILVGRVVNEMGKENTIIEGFIEAKYNEATPTTLTFTHQTWEYFHSEIEKKYKDAKIVGWIHTHPNFGIFLSENDRFIQQNFFTDKNQVAYVVDPIQSDEGFFFWVDNKLELCPGFYIYDKVGTKIKLLEKNKKTEEQPEVTEKTKVTPILIVLILLLAVFNICTVYHYSVKISDLEENVKILNQQMQNLGVGVQQIYNIQKGTDNSQSNASSDKKQEDKSNNTSKTDNGQSEDVDVEQNYISE